MKSTCILIILIVLCLAACSAPGGPPVADMRPVGDGLKLIAYGMVGTAVVLVLGALLRPPP